MNDKIDNYAFKKQASSVKQWHSDTAKVLFETNTQSHYDYRSRAGTVGGITHICFKQWFQITADARPGVSGVSKDQKSCEKFKNTHCQVDHPAIIE